MAGLLIAGIAIALAVLVGSGSHAGASSGGTLGFSPSKIPLPEDPLGVAAGDLNGDGKPDLVTAGLQPSEVSVLLGDGSGGFAQAPGSPIPIPDEGGGASYVAIHDFNGDGNRDFVVDTGSGGVYTMLGAGSGEFTQAPGTPVFVSSGPMKPAVGDFNGDGNPDLAINTHWGGSQDLSVLLGNGSGGFSQAPGSPFDVEDYGNGAVTGDFNGDGYLDLTVGIDTIPIYLGDGSGGFTEASWSPYPIGGNTSINVGDLNADGNLDLVSTHQWDARASVMLGDGSGHFTEAPGSPYATGTHPRDPAIGDFDLDGKPDLAIANGADYNLTVLLGDGSGGFSEATGSPFPVWPGDYIYSLAMGDLNSDGKPDLVAANHYGSYHLTVLLNTTAGYDFGGFSPPVDGPPTLNKLKAGAAVPVKFSLNGDQGLDILAAGYPKSEQTACNIAGEVDGVESTVTAGSSGLSYDPASDRYTYVWKTQKGWAGTCRQFVLKLDDGGIHRANFIFK